MSAPRFLIHGLVVESVVPLGARPASGDHVEFRVIRAQGAAPGIPGTAELLAERAEPRRFLAFRHPQGYTLAFANLCEFWLDPVERTARLYAARELDPEIAGLLVSGVVLPFVLSLGGSLVLHASAVCIDDAVVAIAGASGAGKSTIAGLACVAGSPLMADDALRVERERGTWLAYQGVPALRLREASWSLAPLLGGHVRRTADGRLSAAPARISDAPRAPLRGILFPRYSSSRAMQLESFARSRAVVELLRALRIGSWRSATMLEQQTRAVAALVRDVPTMVLRLPRFERYGRHVAEELASLLRGWS